jgi:hypothetical protein
VDLGHVSNRGEVSSDGLAAAVEALATALEESNASDELVLLASSGAAAGDDLGAVVMASGSPSTLADALRAAPTTDPVDTVTSDSTRRDGVVTSDDVVYTATVFARKKVESPRPIHPSEAADGADRGGRGRVRGTRKRSRRALEAGRLSRHPALRIARAVRSWRCRCCSSGISRR